MFRRIKKLKNIGAYKDEKAGNLQFEPLTFVYGENCYGKSTLCDIFRSLVEDNSIYITNRKTIPSSNNADQIAELSFIFPDSTSETQVSFRGQSWQENIPGNLNILIFDTDFIHRNVFTGLSIERINSENITQFVLGETGSKIANKISNINSDLRSKNKIIRELKSKTFNDIEDIDSFIALNIIETKEDLLKKHLSLSASLKEKEILSKSFSEFKSRENPQKITIKNKFCELIENINELLLKDYQRVHLDAEEKVKEHLKQHTKNVSKTESWVFQGLDQIVNSNCPFCGQEFGEHATNLLSVYQTYFDESFKEYVNKTKNKITVFQSDLIDIPISEYNGVILKNISILEKYSKLDIPEEFSSKKENLISLGNELSQEVDSWNENCHSIKRELNSLLEKKEANIHQSIDSWNNQEILDLFKSVKNKSTEYNSLITTINSILNTFKDGLEISKIEDDKIFINKQILDVHNNLMRINHDAECKKYSDLITKVRTLEKEKAILNNKLEQDQNTFIDNYFEKINAIFSGVGSDKFSILKEDSRRGNLPTINLSASYNGTPIRHDKLEHFFSESDRRALALSIFWAKAESLPNTDQKKTIIIFDDPVTSFDEGRIDKTIRMMELAREQFRQFIILSHYPNYLKSYFIRCNSNLDEIQLIELEKRNDGTHFKEKTSVDFVESPHQKSFRRIKGFIDREQTDDISRELRIFLENEIKSRFYMQILSKNIKYINLSDLISKLKISEEISDPLAAEINQYIKSLNPIHHTWTNFTTEEKIKLANEILNCIYSKL